MRYQKNVNRLSYQSTGPFVCINKNFRFRSPFKTRNLDLLEMLKPLNLSNSDIKRVDKTKSLGVIVDEKLNWDEQFKGTKGEGLAALLKILEKVVPQSQLCDIYYALIESHLRYADVIWGNRSKTKLAALQRLPDRAYPLI